MILRLPMMWVILCVGCSWIDGAPALAQSSLAGRVVVSSAGEAGQRQGNEQRTQPLARLNSRIQNRVPSRLRQRIDRSYDPQQADARAQLATAQDQARVAGRLSRR